MGKAIASGSGRLGAGGWERDGATEPRARFLPENLPA
jgi:hypothetical protein